MPNCLRLLAGFALACVLAYAQDAPISTVRISTDPPGARFYVDGQLYTHPQVFTWPQGSKHVVQFPMMRNPDGTSTNCQTSADESVKHCLDGWVDSTGALATTNTESLIVTASPALTFLTARLTVQYRVFLRFIDLPGGATAPDCTGAPGNAPQDHLRTGVVFVDGNCYGSSANLWMEGGPHTLNAFPYPGFVFVGWNLGGVTVNSPLANMRVNGAMTIAAQFAPAKRVRFVTVPPGLQLLIDRTPTPTSAIETQDLLSDNFPPCEGSLNLPPRPPVTIPALCFGEFDFLPGSRHVLAAVSPQLDRVGKFWTFDRFSNGLEQNGIYTADSNTSTTEVITAHFVPAVSAIFLTQPPGLKLNIDGRENWQSYSFMWGAGTTHTVAAPASQVDAGGRRWTFEGWSNGGAAAQQIVAEEHEDGIRMTARYSALGQLKILTNPPGIALTINGEECVSPCSVDRDAGTRITVSAPATVPIDEASRWEFLGWPDGAPRTRTFTVGPDSETVFANYGQAFRIVVSADPDGSVDVRSDPGSADGFYPADSIVTLTATARPGYRFRRWGGDLEGVYHAGQVSMSGPRHVLASCDKIPYIAPAGIRNAAGETPEPGVAPGSIIAITGESLAPHHEAGPSNPLAQTIADVVVTVNDRMLPLVFVSPQQINAQLPSDLPDGEYTAKVRWTGKPDVTGTFSVTRNAPGLFVQPAEAETRFAMAVREDGAAVTPGATVRRGETVTLMGTGFGPLSPRFLDGFAFPDRSNYLVADPVELTLGELSIRPERTGGAPGTVGVIATRFRIPDNAPSGPADVRITVNGKVSNVVVLLVE